MESIKLAPENIEQIVDLAAISYAKPWKDIGGQHDKGKWFLDLDLVATNIKSSNECPLQLSIDYAPARGIYILEGTPYDHIDNWLKELGVKMNNEMAIKILKDRLIGLLKLIADFGLVKRYDEGEYRWEISTKKHTEVLATTTEPRGITPKVIQDDWIILHNPLTHEASIARQ